MNLEACKKRMQELGYKHEYVAMKMHMSRSCLSGKLNGLRKFTFEEGVELLKILGVNESEIYNYVR